MNINWNYLANNYLKNIKTYINKILKKKKLFNNKFQT